MTEWVTVIAVLVNVPPEYVVIAAVGVPSVIVSEAQGLVNVTANWSCTRVGLAGYPSLCSY